MSLYKTAAARMNPGGVRIGLITPAARGRLNRRPDGLRRRGRCVFQGCLSFRRIGYTFPWEKESLFRRFFFFFAFLDEKGEM